MQTDNTLLNQAITDTIEILKGQIKTDTALLRIGGLAWPNDHRILRRRIAANLAKLDYLQSITTTQN